MRRVIRTAPVVVALVAVVVSRDDPRRENPRRRPDRLPRAYERARA